MDGGAAGAANAANQRTVRAIVVPLSKDAGSGEHGGTKQLPEDPFRTLTDANKLVLPPFDLFALAMTPEYSSALGPCIEAMETNIETFGHRFVPRLKLEKVPEGDELHGAVAAEAVRLENFFTYASLDCSFRELRRRRRKDLESTGNAYYEVLRGIRGDIQGLVHIPSYQVRLSPADPVPTKVEMPILERQIDGSVKVVRIQAWRRFRRFAQTRLTLGLHGGWTGGAGVRWFKEFQDSRVYNNDTGELVDDPAEIAKLPEVKRANELVHFKLYSARSPYGLPRYIGQLLSICGDRKAEEINFTTFSNNNIPSMMLLVSNGQLTEGSIERVKEFVETNVKGTDNMARMLILEAEGFIEGEDGGQVKLDAKPLTQVQHKDALFQKYQEGNGARIRSAFRLTGLFLGRSDDYTRSTADASRRVTDEQVFGPERDEFDDWWNHRVFPEMGVVYHRFRSNSPTTTDSTELVKILASAERTGGMTPRIARQMLGEILGQEMPAFPVGFDPDMPFSLLMAEAVKNKADPAEVGQQVTALKLIEGLTGADAQAVEENEGKLVEALLRLRAGLEKSFYASVGSLEDSVPTEAV